MGSNVFAPAMWPASAFQLEGGRLAAMSRPTGGELCLKQESISAPQSTFQVQGNSTRVRVAVSTDARTYLPRTGSNALGGTG